MQQASPSTHSRPPRLTHRAMSKQGESLPLPPDADNPRFPSVVNSNGRNHMQYNPADLPVISEPTTFATEGTYATNAGPGGHSVPVPSPRLVSGVRKKVDNKKGFAGPRATQSGVLAAASPDIDDYIPVPPSRPIAKNNTTGDKKKATNVMSDLDKSAYVPIPPSRPSSRKKATGESKEGPAGPCATKPGFSIWDLDELIARRKSEHALKCRQSSAAAVAPSGSASGKITRGDRTNGRAGPRGDSDAFTQDLSDFIPIPPSRPVLGKKARGDRNEGLAGSCTPQPRAVASSARSLDEPAIDIGDEPVELPIEDPLPYQGPEHRERGDGDPAFSEEAQNMSRIFSDEPMSDLRLTDQPASHVTQDAVAIPGIVDQLDQAMDRGMDSDEGTAADLRDGTLPAPIAAQLAPQRGDGMGTASNPQVQDRSTGDAQVEQLVRNHAANAPLVDAQAVQVGAETSERSSTFQKCFTRNHPRRTWAMVACFLAAILTASILMGVLMTRSSSPNTQEMRSGTGYQGAAPSTVPTPTPSNLPSWNPTVDADALRVHSIAAILEPISGVEVLSDNTSP